MAGIGFFNNHRPWEDGVGMLLGILIGLSPWLADQQTNQIVMWNAILIGAGVFVLSQLGFFHLRRWEEGCEIALGLWLFWSPFVFRYAEISTLAYWHFALGLAVVLLAWLELRQDWNLSDQELAQHGQ